MSLIPDTRWRAFDSSGNPLVGATLTIYDTGTTTPSAVFRDSTLSTPMTNPTEAPDVSDSGGWFPQIFAAEGGLYDITLKTSGGVTVKSYLGVPSFGTGAATITRDFGNSRLRIAGSGGVVSFEGGDPSGDDSGGKVRIGGYLGTQADTISLDGAAVSTSGAFATGGLITENSKKLPGVVYSSGTVSASSGIIVPLTNSPTGVQAWDIDLINLWATAGNPDLMVRLSFDNGATYVSDTQYDWVATGTSGSGASAGKLIVAMSSGTNVLAGARLRMLTADTSPKGSYANPTLTGIVAGPGVALGGVTYTGNQLRATHVKFYPSSSTINGSWRVIPLRGSGDA